jgi:hypothetical protein
LKKKKKKNKKKKKKKKKRKKTKSCRDIEKPRARIRKRVYSRYACCSGAIELRAAKKVAKKKERPYSFPNIRSDICADLFLASRWTGLKREHPQAALF